MSIGSNDAAYLYGVTPDKLPLNSIGLYGAWMGAVTEAAWLPEPRPKAFLAVLHAGEGKERGAPNSWLASVGSLGPTHRPHLEERTYRPARMALASLSWGMVTWHLVT